MICKKCKAESPKGNKFCKECGAKFKKPIYQRVWFWILVVVIGLGAIGRSGDTPSSEPVQATPDIKADETKEVVQNEIKQEEKKEVQKDEYILGEVAHLKGMDVQVVGTVVDPGSEFIKPKEGSVFVITDIVMKNVSDRALNYNVFDFKMQNSNGQITDGGFTLANNENPLSSGSLAVGGIVRGTIAFEQPAGDNNLKLIYSNNIFSSKDIKIDLANKIDGFEVLSSDNIASDGDLPKIGEPLQFEGAEIVVTDVSKNSGGDWNPPTEGYEYMTVKVSIKNISDKTLSYNPYYFKVQNSMGNIKDQSSSAIDMDTYLDSGELAAGGNVSGTITFEVPKDDSGLVFIYEPNFITGNQARINLK